MKWLDLPPLWLLLHLGAVWASAPSLPLGVSAPWVVALGTALLALGLGLMAAAVGTMWRAKTTPIPHREASHLVDSGVFGLSRNPIYVGDALVLAGVILRAGAPLLLPLVPAFMWVIQRRFIEPEEARLQRQFGQRFEEFCSRTPRWLLWR